MPITRTAVDTTWEAVDNAANGVAHGAYTDFSTPLNDGDTLNVPASVYPSGGTFTITIAGVATSALAYNASAATVQAAVRTAAADPGAIVTGDRLYGFVIKFSVDKGVLAVTATSSLTPSSLNIIRVVTVQAYSAGSNPPTSSKPQMSSVVLGVAWTQQLFLTKNIVLKGQGDQTNDVTVIINCAPSGKLLDWQVNNSHFTARLSGFRLHHHLWPGSNAGWIKINGNGLVHLFGGAVVGGMRIDHNHITPAAEELAKSWQIRATGYMSGVVDHNFVDCDPTWTDVSIWTFQMGTEPDLTGRLGYWSWWEDFVFGDDPLSQHAWYFEDNVIHHTGGWLDVTDSGGTRYISRFNTTWGHNGGHGSTAGAGMRAREVYNNHFLNLPGVAHSVGALTNRGGAAYETNNRFTAWYPPGSAPISAPSDERQGGVGSCMGPSDGTNFLDQNERGTITKNGRTFVPIYTPSEARIGSIYASNDPSKGGTSGSAVPSGGTSNNPQYLVNGLASTANGDWKGFCFRLPAPIGPPESAGGQQQVPFTWRTIIDSVVSGSNTVITLINPGSGSAFGTGTPWVTNPASCLWEIRRVKECLGAVGSGKWNGFADGNVGLAPPQACTFQAPGSIPNPNPSWVGQQRIGVWQWANKYRASSTASFVPTPPIAGGQNGVSTIICPGGAHDEVVPTIANGAIANYPVNNTSPKRIGADWDAPGYAGESLVDATITNYGSVYPHPLVTGDVPVVTKIISLEGDLAFGSVSVGSFAERQITIRNTGNTAFSFSNVTSNDVRFVPQGTLSGTINPGAVFLVTIRFTPAIATSYSGTITVVVPGDVTGTNTMAASGTGVAVTTVIWAIQGNLNFGTIGQNSNAFRDIVFTNNGTGMGTVTALPHDPGVSLNWTFPRNIPAGGSDTLRVTADTTSTGTFSGTINITSNATSGVDHIDFNFVVGFRRIGAVFRDLQTV